MLELIDVEKIVPLMKLVKDIPTVVGYGSLALAGLASSGALNTPLRKLVAKLVISGSIMVVVSSKASKIILPPKIAVPIKPPSEDLLLLDREAFLERQSVLWDSSFYIDSQFKVYFGGLEELDLNQIKLDSVLLEATQQELLQIVASDKFLLVSDVITRIVE